MGGRRQARCGRSTLSTSGTTRSSSSDAGDDDSLIKRSKACAIIEELSSEESSSDKEGSGGCVSAEGANQARIQLCRGAKIPKAPNAAVC